MGKIRVSSIVAHTASNSAWKSRVHIPRAIDHCIDNKNTISSLNPTRREQGKMSGWEASGIVPRTASKQRKMINMGDVIVPEVPLIRSVSRTKGSRGRIAGRGVMISTISQGNTCFGCHEIGHIKRSCPNAKAKMARQRKIGSRARLRHGSA